MPVNGRKYRLLLYTYTLNHWWRRTLAIGLILMAMVAVVVWLPTFLPQYTPPRVPSGIIWFAGGVGGFAIVITIFILSIRKSAYIQPYTDHLRLVTPFMSMDISYRRIVQTISAEMGLLFPLDKFKGWRREFLRPLARRTAVVLDLKGWPLPPKMLHLFLSTFFFPDKTPRLALLIPDWMNFSNEMESYRSVWMDSIRRSGSTPQSEILASFSEKQ